MSAEQRQYLQALRDAPLRLWEVTEVSPGVGLTLTDCLDASWVCEVWERSASTQLKQWDVIGARPVPVADDRRVLSGAIYHIPRVHVDSLLRELKKVIKLASKAQECFIVSRTIASLWLRLRLELEPFMPQTKDAVTGEPMMFITEHYRVQDWDALAARLDASADVEGDGKQGWNRLQALDKGMNRSLVAINIGAKKDRLELFTKSIKAADAQQVWFEQLAGDAVRRLTREMGDPLSLLRHGGDVDAPGPEIPDDVQCKLQHDYKQRHYADWADTPLPALKGKTARQAVKTKAGKKAVISMLKDFENGEARNEHPFDFGFLWKDLGLEG